MLKGGVGGDKNWYDHSCCASCATSINHKTLNYSSIVSTGHGLHIIFMESVCMNLGYANSKSGDSGSSASNGSLWLIEFKNQSCVSRHQVQ